MHIESGYRVNYERAYREYLNDLYPAYKIGFSVFTADQILEALDPIAYHQGFLDYENMMTEGEEE